MRKNMSKKRIIAESNKIRSEFRHTKLEKIQKGFIKYFIKNKRKFIIIIFFLVIFEILIGLSLPTISHFYLEKNFALMNYQTFLYVGLFLIFLLILYLIGSYFRIYFIQKINLDFINAIRESWYKYYLKHSVAFNRRFDGKKLMTKLVYHVQLLKMGLNNIVYDGIQALFLYLGIIIFSFFFNPKLFLLLWISLPVLIIIFLVTDYIGRYYVTREQTFNSRIIAHLADSLLNFDVLKAHSQENEKIKEFDNYIDLDTFFRIRRQVLIEYSNKVLYGLIFLFVIFLYFIQLYWPFIEFSSMRNVASTGFILGFFVRVLFSTSRVGIFMEAFRLGLRLSVPSFKISRKSEIKKIPSWKKIRFYGKKTKLSRHGGYIKNFELEIAKKDRLLIVSNGNYGKTTLAKIIAGRKAFSSINLMLDKQRITSKNWSRFKSNNYFISPNTSFDTTIGEFLLGKSKSDFSQNDIHTIVEALKPFNFFKFLLDKRDFIGHRITNRSYSVSEIILLQIAHCLLFPKKIITIDNLCLDSQNKSIIDGLHILEQKLPDTSLIFFSSKINNEFKYGKVFKLDKASFKAV